MKKIIILFALCVFNASGCFPQETMSKGKFDTLVDYMNGNITKAYIEWTINTERWSSKEPDSTAYHDNISQILKDNSLDKPVSFETLKNKLNEGKHWSETFNKVTAKYNSIKNEYAKAKAAANDGLIDILFNFEISNNTLNKHSATKDECEKWKSTIRDRFSPKPPEESGTPTKIEERLKKIEERLIKLENKANSPTGTGKLIAKNIPFIAIAVVLLLLCVVLYVYFRKKKPCYSETPESNGYDTESLLPKIRELEKELNKMTGDYSSMAVKYGELEKQYSSLTAKINQTGVSNPSTNPPVIKQSSSKTFYMSAPNSDGSFWVRNSKQELDPTASCYKFDETAPGVANFSTVDAPAFFSLALQNPSFIIEPVCEPLNPRTSERKRIITKSPGKAQKDGDKWIVTEKAKIRYE
jgi:hypothetical protein